MVPKKIFFTKGVGVHKDRLQSFKPALRAAGIAKCKLVMDHGDCGSGVHQRGY